ncbi:hypothetical protein [Speluncibacter jeojiensis]|uniref:Uncharacterized protein n=1 Tax=Speluncibacter jeojiensis TaxID=2710754 RepID=A0A9X4M8G3_9ACTN|nr:hypothetical protein [Corynebacteriales bacterium D3-21]
MAANPVGSAIGVEGSNGVVGGLNNASQQCTVDRDRIEQMHYGGASVGGDLGVQVVVAAETAVDELHRMEIEVIRDVQRGVPAGPPQICGGKRPPVAVGIRRQRGRAGLGDSSDEVDGRAHTDSRPPIPPSRRNAGSVMLCETSADVDAGASLAPKHPRARTGSGSVKRLQ